jgi:hypothetical protein
MVWNVLECSGIKKTIAHLAILNSCSSLQGRGLIYIRGDRRNTTSGSRILKIIIFFERKIFFFVQYL